MDDFDEPLPPPLEFRLDGRLIIAKKAELLDPDRTVYRLDLEEPLFLPPIVTLKKQKPKRKDQFNTEKKAYDLLKPIQGVVIPKFYGEAMYDTSSALVLSAITGTTLLELARRNFPEREETALEAEIDKALQALVSYGVTYSDERLDNFFLADDGHVKIVDLEHVNLNSTTIWQESFNHATAGCLMYRFTIARDPNSLPPLDPRAYRLMESRRDNSIIDVWEGSDREGSVGNESLEQ